MVVDLSYNSFNTIHTIIISTIFKIIRVRELLLANVHATVSALPHVVMSPLTIPAQTHAVTSHVTVPAQPFAITSYVTVPA